MKYIRLHTQRFVFLIALFVAVAGLSACGGSGSTTTASNASLTGSVVDGKVSGATLTLYSDQAMTTQVGSGSTDSTGAFSITLTVATAPDPVYIKSTGGTNLDTGMPAPTMRFVGNTSGANALTTLNVTPLTDDVFTRIDNGDSLSAAQSNARTAFGLSSNTGTDGLYEDPSAAANSGLLTAEFKKLTAGTIGSTIPAGTYKMFALTLDESDIGATVVAGIGSVGDGTTGTSQTLLGSNAFVEATLTVASNGDISGSAGGGNVFTGKIVGSSMMFNIVDSATPASVTQITRVVGNIGLNGSVAGNFTDVTGLGVSPAMTKGVFVGTLIPSSGINATNLSTFISNFYTPGSSTGLMNVVARDIFITSGSVPQVHWGRTAVTAVSPGSASGNGTLTMDPMTMRGDSGSAATSVGTFTFAAGVYVKSGTVPTNLLAFKTNIPSGGANKLYVVTAIGLRRGIYFVTNGANSNKIMTVGEAYLSKVDSVAPSGFTAGATHDVVVANIHPGMPGGSRANALTQGLSPSAVTGGMTVPALGGSLVAMDNGYIDTGSGAPELMIFQGSMFVMKKDANNDFLGNFNNAAPADHLRVVEFFESGAMQGEEIQGGSITAPGGGSVLMRNFPENFVGFVHDQASSATPSFTGTLNFLARTIYASSFTGFVNAFTSGTLEITAPVGSTAGSATLIATPGGGTSATSTLTVDAPASGAPGVYHIHGTVTGSGGQYIDITWPIGGTKALYALSAAVDGNVSEVGEAYITQ